MDASEASHDQFAERLARETGMCVHASLYERADADADDWLGVNTAPSRLSARIEVAIAVASPRARSVTVARACDSCAKAITGVAATNTGPDVPKS